MKRIVSMIASSTEIVCALGFGDWLVGRSHECDFPKSVSKLPVLTKPKLNVDDNSRKIDEDVKDLLRKALSIYQIDGEELGRLKPDVILTQSQCKVCAVTASDVEKAVCAWTGGSPTIVSLEPNSLEDIWDDIRKVAAALEFPGHGDALVKDLKRRVSDIGERCVHAKTRPRVAMIEWIDPLMAGGNWVPELVNIAGGDNLFGEAGKHSSGMEWEALVAGDPDIIISLPCGFDLDRTRKEMAVFSQRSGWKDLQAVRDGRVFIVDGNQFFNRPGPRVVESLEILAEILHPELFPSAQPGAERWEAYA